MGFRQNLKGLAAAATGDDEKRYRLAERLARAIHPEAILGGRGRIWLHDAEYRSIFGHFRGPQPGETMERAYFIGQLAQLANAVPGDTAECGTYTGLTSHEICRFTQPGKVHHAFDSFLGVSAPIDLDGSYWTEGDLSAGVQEFETNLAGFDVRTYEGWIPDRFADVEELTFSFVHIDVDMYEPTRDSFAFFYDRTVAGGVIICDDYGFSTCPGATKAVDEFMANRREPIVRAPTGQAIIFKR